MLECDEDEDGGEEPLIQELDLDGVVACTPPELLEHPPVPEPASSGEPTPMPESTPPAEPTPPQVSGNTSPPPDSTTAPSEETTESVSDVTRTQLHTRFNPID